MKLLPPSALAQEIWDSALLTRPDRHFLQSWAWGEFQLKLGNPIWRLAVEHDGEIVNQLLVIRLSLGFGWYILYSPRGSIVNKRLSAQLQQESAKLLLQEINRLGHTNRTILFRIDPNAFAHDALTLSFYRSNNFIPNPYKNIQPRHIQLVKLDTSDEVLRQQMKPKPRYNINVATKHEVLIKSGTGEEDIKEFARLATQTGRRQGFIPHSTNYYITQIHTLHQAGMGNLLFAEKLVDVDEKIINDTPLGSIFLVTFGDTTTYVHGASSDTYKNLMAPYLLHWFGMTMAKRRGMRFYDLGGIHPDPDHPWAGITRFKQGFGGQAVEYIGTLELPLNRSLYRIYSFISRFR